MTRQTKPVFSQKTETVFADAMDMKATDMRAPDMRAKDMNAKTMNTKDLGIEFVHFDNDGNIENQHTMPLGQFISDTPLSSEEYFITRSLVAARAGK
ncbi:MAG: hypothetical protein VW472_00890 [Candidatus Puniceispirillum sp.]